MPVADSAVRGGTLGLAVPHPISRWVRYGGVSVLTVMFAQAGLALGYGLLRWATTPAVGLSLLTSVVPAYWLNRRYVWPERSTKTSALPLFGLLALAGSGITAITTFTADHLARSITGEHAVLTLIVNGTALVTTILVWLLRFMAFDRFVFNGRSHRTTERFNQ